MKLRTKNFDGVWFPEMVVFTHKGVETARITVLDVEINQAHHPTVLTPKEPGLVPDVQVLHSTRGQMACTLSGGQRTATKPQPGELWPRVSRELADVPGRIEDASDFNAAAYPS